MDIAGQDAPLERSDTSGRRAENARAKRQAILDGAREAFMRDGFGATSMDAVAEAAAVSKMTVYRHFRSKEALFAGLIAHLCDRMFEGDLVAGMAELAPEVALRRYAERFLDTVFGPETVVLHRIVVAEAARFPDLGRLFYESGPAASIAGLAAYLRAHRDDPRLDVDDPLEAAEEFLETLRGYEHLRVVLGVSARPDRRKLERRIDRAISRLTAAE